MVNLESFGPPSSYSVRLFDALLNASQAGAQQGDPLGLKRGSQMET